MSEQIKVGLITHAGGVHLSAYFRALAQADEAGSVVLADPDGRWADDARKALGNKLTKVYKDRDEMLAREKPAMALVSMEAKLAPPAIDAALEAGCHVFAEKPACVRGDDFQKLVTKADSKHLYLMLALANRLKPEIAEARRLIAGGQIGKIYGLEMHLIADQTRLTRPAYHKSWFADRQRAAGGHLAWLGIHWLDLAMYVTGSRIEQVAGFAGNVGGQPIKIEDSVAMSMRFENGTFGTLTSGYYLDRGYHSHIQIWGSHGWLRLNAGDAPPLEWYSTKGTETPEVKTFAAAQGGDAYSVFVRAALRASAGLQDPPITAQASLRALNTVFSLYRAAESGETEQVG